MLNVFNQSLWGDEGFSAILSLKPSLIDVIKTVAGDTSPPLWNISEWLAFKVFGISEVVVRSVSLFYFLIAVFFTYKIATLVWNKRVGLYAALLTLLNPFFFTYAFEGRMYSIMAAGVAGSMYFFLKLLKTKKPQKKDLVGYVITTLWALYSHHFAIFALFTQGLWFLYEAIFGKRSAAKRMFKGFIFVGIGYIPWLLPLYNQTKMVGGGFWLSTPSLEDLKNLILEYLAEGIKHEYSVYARYLVLAALILKKWGKKLKMNIFFLSWFLLPILLTWIVSQKFTSIFFNRYLLYSIPAAMILLAAGRRKISNYLIWGVIILFAIIDFNYFTNPTKIPFNNLASYVLETKEKGDLIINEDAGSHKLWETKFYGIPAPIYVPEGNELPFFVGTALMEETDIISEIPDDTNNLGVITYKSGAELKFPGYITVEERSFGNLNFVWMGKTR